MEYVFIWLDQDEMRILESLAEFPKFQSTLFNLKLEQVVSLEKAEKLVELKLIENRRVI